jgi:hypothetical protein
MNASSKAHRARVVYSPYLALQPRLSATYLVILFTATITGCSMPSRGPAPTPPPAQLAVQALKGLLQAETLHYSGTVDKLGTPYTVDITVNQKGDMRGSLTLGKSSSRSVEILKAGAVIYQRGRGYWTGVVDSVTLKVYDDNWIRTGADTDLSPAFAIASSEVERDLLDRFKPANATATALAGSPATKLTGREGNLYVTQSQPVRALRFAGASGFTSRGGLGHISLDYKYPVALDLAQPQTFVDPGDHSTWPAEFAVDRADQGTCGPSHCDVTAVLHNHGGQSVGQATATFTLTDDGGHKLGSCATNVPPVGHDQTETVGCAVSGPDWTSFTQRGGNYTEGVNVHNPVYDD